MKTRDILFVIYPGFELLDLSGPVSVFSTANALRKTANNKKPPYQIHTLSMDAGLITSSASLEVNSQAAASITITADTTILVVGAGAPAIHQASNNVALQEWLRKHCHEAERIGSICSGAFILAAAGLLENRMATTHWAGCNRLAKMYPKVNLKPESLYVVDDNLWTSAGVSTGLDMALEMLRRDLGKSVMDRVAKQLVVFSHRPGNQSQFSTLLKQQTRSSNDYSDLLAWIDNNLHLPIKVEALASLVNMSERTFYRKFTAEMGVTPSKYVEEAKLVRAKFLIEDNLPISHVAAAVGFKSDAAFRTRFENRFDLTPSLYRRLHGAKEK